LYKQLLFNDIRGPSIPNGIELPPIQPNLADMLLAVKPTKEICLNYNVSTINLAYVSKRVIPNITDLNGRRNANYPE